MEKEEIKQLIIKKGLTIEQVIDAVIELNSLIGVGLITLSDHIDSHIKSKLQ